MKQLVVLPMLLALAACKQHEPAEHASLMDTIQGTMRPNRNAGLNSESSGASLTIVEHVPAMSVRSRESALEKFPCQTCHKDLVKTAGAQRKAHWQIELKHAAESVMQCSTCHFEQDMNRLRTLAGKPVEFDHSYGICAQCHSQQAADWAGGAHGKRVGGWAPPRVAQTCVECHNPHAPAWGRRWPAVAGTSEVRQ